MADALRPKVGATGLWLCVVCGACGGPGQGDDNNSTPEWTAALDLRIGSIDDPEYALTYFRAMEVGPDGTMYTVHPQEQVVRVFEPDGTLRRVIGGRGDGPGEFQNLAEIGWIADTLWVLDYNGYRFTQFDASGELLGSFSVPFEMDSEVPGAQPPRARELLWDGTLVGGPPAFSHQIASGELTHDLPMIMTRDGRVTDTLPPIAFGRNLWAITDPDAPERGGMYRPQPYADGPLWAFAARRRAVIVVDREAPTVADGATFAVSLISFEGDTLFQRSYPYEPVPTRQEVADSILGEVAEMIGERGFLGATSSTARAWAELGLYRPKFRPPVEAMIVADDGSIWLSRGTTGGGGSVQWLVLDEDGRPLASVDLPSGLTLLTVSPPALWATERDEFDVPYLVRFTVSPGSDSAI